MLRKEDIDDLRLGGVPAWLIELEALRKADGDSYALGVVERKFDVIGLDATRDAVLWPAGEFDLAKDRRSRFRDRDGLCSRVWAGPGLEQGSCCSAIVLFRFGVFGLFESEWYSCCDRHFLHVV